MYDYKKTVIFNYGAIGINLLTGFILFPLIIKYLGIEKLGIFGLFYSIKSIFDMGMGWLTGGITKNLIKYKYLKNNIFTISFIVNILYGFIVFLFFLLYGYINDLFFISALFGFGTLLNFIIVPYSELLISQLRQYQVAFFRFLQQSLFLILSISLFLFNKKLSQIFLGYLISAILTFFLYYSYIKYKNLNIKLVFKNFFSILKKLFFLDSLKYFMNAVSTQLLLQIDILLISYLYGNKSAGVYLIIFKIPNTLIMLGWRLSEPFQAIVAKEIKQNKEKIFNDFRKLEKNIFLLSLMAGIGYLIFGKYILELWIGDDNIPNIHYMYIIPSLVILFSIMQRLYLSINFYTKRLEIVTKLQFIEIFFKVIFIIFFFDYFKELAPIVGWMVGFLFTIWIYRKNSLEVFENG